MVHIYVPAFIIKQEQLNVGKYTSPIDPMGSVGGSVGTAHGPEIYTCRSNRLQHQRVYHAPFVERDYPAQCET